MDLSSETVDFFLGCKAFLSLAKGVGKVVASKLAKEAGKGVAEAASNEVKALASTGRTAATNLTEKLAMEQAVSNPTVGKVIPIVMNDAKNGWYAADGWVVKMSQNIN